MFTGIVERTAKILSASDGVGFRRLLIAAAWDDVKLGESIALSGVCLTVAELSRDTIAFDVIRETLDKTNLDDLQAGSVVNLERSLRVGDRIDGHFVQGHVDCTGHMRNIINTAAETRLTIQPAGEFMKYIVPKGSICVDGVSLTIASATTSTFDVALIPTTLAITNLGARSVGDRVNLEADILAKTIVHYMDLRK
jgi:riboflavin synthase